MSAIWASLQSDGLNLFTPTTTEVCGGTVQLWRSPKPSEKNFVNSSESGREREEDRFLENNVHRRIHFQWLTNLSMICQFSDQE